MSAISESERATKKAKTSHHTPTLLPEPTEKFPIDLSKFQPLKIDPFTTTKLNDEQKQTLLANIELCRDAIVVFTACGKSGAIRSSILSLFSDLSVLESEISTVLSFFLSIAISLV